ncbi:M17 family metallopeptidase [Jatrophihabitans sp. YIM 134969]
MTGLEQVQAAFEAAIAGGRVSVLAARDDVGRSVAAVFAEDVSTDDSAWLPFRGAAGELAAAGPTLHLGLGARAGASVETLRVAAVAAGAALTGGDIGLSLPPGLPGDLVRALVDGLVSGHTHPAAVRLHVSPPHLADARRGVLDAEVTHLAATLTNAPADLATPAAVAEWASNAAPRAGLTCTVRGPERVRADGFGALDAIGRGSVNGPHLLELEYRGGDDGPALALVGKGITFDSGGLSLKSPAAMMAMRLDMAGAAVVLAVMCTLQRLGCRSSVRAVLPLAENLPGPGATRPGDVVTAWNGTQIQLLDLDFEGRVVLADALALAASYRPALLVDLATLTYQAEIALGPEIGALIARSDDAATRVLTAAGAAGEPLWRLPWAPRYLDQVRTPTGVRNHPLRDTGRALTAALFLGEFVPETVPWVHLDIVGPTWRGDASVDGGTGFGTRTLLQVVVPAGWDPAS